MQTLKNGVIVPIITPANHNDIFPIIDHIVKGGVKIIFLLGTTGEALQTPHADKIKLIQRVSEYVDDSIQLLVGVSSRNINEVYELINTCENSRVFAHVVAPLVIGDDAANVMQSVLTHSHKPILIYNHPGLTNGRSIPVEIIASFMNHARVLGIKDSSGDIDYFKQLIAIRAQQKHFKIYAGTERTLKEIWWLDFDGYVPSTANIYPELSCQMWQDKPNAPWDEWLAAKKIIRDKNANSIIAIKEILGVANHQ